MWAKAALWDWEGFAWRDPDMEQPEDLILLVGSNPLPNYIAVALLRPKRVHLVYSPQVGPVYQRLKQCIEAAPLAIPTTGTTMADATDARMIRKVAQSLPQGAGLHYTGGTKTMATHTYAV